MNCPQCKGRTMIAETARHDSGVRRMRKCKDAICDYRFLTEELFTVAQRYIYKDKKRRVIA